MGFYVTNDTKTRVPIYTFIMLLSSFPFPVSPNIEVSSFGVRPSTPGDTAIVFYASATHKGSKEDASVAASLQMQKCCLKLSNGTNCDVMKLISGLGIVFHPQDTYTLEMYFVNFDVTDREGSCTLSVRTRPLHQRHDMTQEMKWEVGQEFTINFTTSKHHFLTKLLSSVGLGSMKSCSRNKECACNHCLIRFAGVMSLSDNDTGQCETTPACNDRKRMISLKTGKCGEAYSEVEHGNFIRSTFTREMMKGEEAWYASRLANGKLGSQKLNRFHSVNCEHGRKQKDDENRTICTCDHGWRSLTQEEWERKGGALEPDGTAPIYTQCNIPTIDHGKRGLLLYGFLILSLVAVCSALAYNFVSGRKHKNDGTSSKASLDGLMDEEEEEDGSMKPSQLGCHKEEDEDADKIINEIAHRREQRPKSNVDLAKDKDQGPPPTSTPSKVPTTSQSSVNKGPEKSSRLELPPYSYSEKFEKDHVQLATSGARLPPTTQNTLFAQVEEVNFKATLSPSTDELLTMQKNERARAHIPMKPVSASSSRSSVTAHNDLLQLENYINNNNSPVVGGGSSLRSGPFSTSSLSSEEVTLQKREQWDQYMKSVSGDNLSRKSSHCSIQVDENKNVFTTPTRYTGAVASQSVPLMQQRSDPTHIPKPPQGMIQKSLMHMSPQEYARRQDAYNLLKSFSTPTLELKRGDQNNNNDTRTVSPSSSYWFNLESPAENLEAHRANNEVRVNSIYGDMGSDRDSDEALNSISNSANCSISSKQTVAERFQENQRLLSISQNQGNSRQSPVIPGTHGQPEFTLRNLEFNKIPSDVYTATSSSNSSHECLKFPDWLSLSRGPEVQNDFGGPSRQNSLLSSSRGGSTNVIVIRTASTENARLTQVSPETSSAYRIKESLQNVLKASRSRSSHNFF